MGKLILTRLAVMLPMWIAVTLLAFLMVKLVPGDPAQVMLGERASPQALQKVRAELGLDKPITHQIYRYYTGLLTGDLGRSVTSHEPVITELIERFPATVELAITAMFIALLVGIPAGVIAAVRRGSGLDLSAMAASTVGVSIPIFCLGLGLMYLVAFKAGWLPSEGRLSVVVAMGHTPITGFVLLDSLLRWDFVVFGDAVAHLILPSVTLATIPTAVIARITRASVLDVLGREYILAARARGLSEWRVIAVHALRNGLLPTTAAIGVQFGSLLGGAVITETIFAWPGIGRWLWQAIAARDFPSVQGGVLLVASVFLLVNLIVDLLQGWIDPRVRAT